MSDLRARHAGETRKKVRRITMRMEATVTVDWPDGVPFDEADCKSIALAAMPQRWERQVGSGRVKGLIWATAYSECMDYDVEIIEDIEINPPTYRPIPPGRRQTKGGA